MIQWFIFCVLGFTTNQRAGATPPSPSGIRDRDVEGAPLRRGLRLGIYLEGFGLPVSEVLAVEGMGKPRLISKMEEFKGLMDIRDPDAALRFVRLRTYLWGDSTMGYWLNPKGPMMEIMTPEGYRKKGRELGFRKKGLELRGDHDIGWIQDGNDGFCGIVYSGSLRDELDGYPMSRRNRKGFIVTRLVAVRPYKGAYDDGTRLVERVSEQVGTDGAYNLLSIRPVTTGPLTKVAWFFPLKM